MNVQEEILESVKTTSKLCTTTLVAVALVTLYLLQRAVGALLGSVDATSATPQAGIGGVPGFGVLEFSFASLSIVWPLVLSMFCLAFARGVNKLIWIWEQFTSSCPDVTPDQLIAISPVWIASPADPHEHAKARWWGWVKWVPCVALVLHPVAVTWSTFDIAVLIDQKKHPHFVDLQHDTHLTAKKDDPPVKPVPIASQLIEKVDSYGKSAPEQSSSWKLNYLKFTFLIVFTVAVFLVTALAWPPVRRFPKSIDLFSSRFGTREGKGTIGKGNGSIAVPQAVQGTTLEGDMPTNV